MASESAAANARKSAFFAVDASVAGATLERYKDKGMIASHALVRQDGKAFESICEAWCADG